jgi:hypothetical protein
MTERVCVVTLPVLERKSAVLQEVIIAAAMFAGGRLLIGCVSTLH